MIPATNSTASNLAEKFKKGFKSAQSCKIISEMPKPLLGVSKLLHLRDTSAPFIFPFAPSAFPIPNSSWKTVHRSQPKKLTAMGGLQAAGGFFKDGKGCGAWAGGHGVGGKASTPRSPIQGKPQGSCRTERGLKRSWRAEQGDIPVHSKKLL